VFRFSTNGTIIDSLYMSPNKVKNDERWLVIDTDAGVDDAVALCLAMQLFELYGVTIKFLSCVQGNTSLENVVVNVGKCVKICNDDPPIYVGANSSLDGTQFDAQFYHGKDGLGDATIDHPRTGPIEGKGSVEAFIDVSKEAAKQKNVHLTLLMLGPLTNLALAIRKEPNISSMVNELIIMGGCGNAKGNITRTAEFNIFNDCEAADIVFKNWNSPTLTIVPWELCSENSIEWVKFDELFTLKSPVRSNVGVFLSKILQFTFGTQHQENRLNLSGAVICDVIAMACFLDPSVVIEKEFVHVEVELQSSLTRGQTVVDWGCYDGIKRSKNVKWVTKINKDMLIRMLEKMCFV